MQSHSPVIRSFVRREGRFTKAQRKAIEEHWVEYGIDTNEKILNLQKYFNNRHPIILDIGFGNGEELISLAKQYENINFLGVEVYRPGIGSLLKKIADEYVENIRVVSIDAVDLLNKNISQESLTAVLIWFPDPWPKKRHHKRRLIQSAFIKLIASRLINRGELHIATDWQPYAEHIQETVMQSLLFNKLSSSSFINMRPQTKFERRGQKLGHRVFNQVYKKIR